MSADRERNAFLARKAIEDAVAERIAQLVELAEEHEAKAARGRQITSAGSAGVAAATAAAEAYRNAARIMSGEGSTITTTEVTR